MREPGGGASNLSENEKIETIVSADALKTMSKMTAKLRGQKAHMTLRVW